MTDFHVPMTRLAVETALLANGTNLMNFIGFIIKKVKEVKMFRDECSKLVNISIELSLSYLEHQKDLQKIRSGKEFLQTLQRVYLLVIECSQSWSKYHIGWEVFCVGKVEKLTKELSSCQKAFMTEITMNINSTVTGAAASLITMRTELASIGTAVAGYQDDRDRLDRGFTEIEREIVDNRDERQRFNQSISEIRLEIEDNRQGRNSWRPTRLPTFPVLTAPDDRVVLDELQNDAELAGLFEGRAAIFHKISGFFPSRSRIIKIYQMIREVAPPNMMQRLHGVFDADGTEFLIMERDNSHQTLLEFIQSRAVQDLTMLQKLSFCYDLVSLISILHGLDLVVKSITDVNILVQRPEGENPRPKLINLHFIRRRLDPSGREDIDWRFDAPETPKAGTRSKMSDIWSVGIILQEIFTQSLPFSTGPCSKGDYASTHLLPTLSLPPEISKSEIAELANRQVASVGSHAQVPFKTPEPKLPTSILELVTSAMARDPMLRPSASKLAQGLMEQLLRETTMTSNDMTDLKTQMTEVDMSLVEHMIHEAKSRKNAVANARVKKEPLPPKKILFGTHQIEELLSIAQRHTNEPAVLFAVGSVYLWGLCGIAEGNRMAESGLPADVFLTEKAISYLKSANEQGYDAVEDLYHAHKELARFYHEKLTRRNDL